MKQQKQILALAIGLALAGTFAYFFIPGWNPLSVTGKMAVGLTLVHEDGTETAVDPERDWMSYWSPLAIKTLGGAAVTSVKYTVQVKPIFTGTVTSISYADSFIQITVDLKVKQSRTASAFSGSLTSGEWTTVASGTITADTLSDWSTDGNHQLKIIPKSYVEITFSDGNIITRSATCTGSWAYTKEPATPTEPTGSFTGLSITVDETPLT